MKRLLSWLGEPLVVPRWQRLLLGAFLIAFNIKLLIGLGRAVLP